MTTSTCEYRYKPHARDGTTVPLYRALKRRGHGGPRPEKTEYWTYHRRDNSCLKDKNVSR